MGAPMAGHLLSAGHALTVHTRTPAKADGITRRGANYADTPAEAAKDADVVFLCVPDTPDVQAIVTGDHGVMQSARRGMIVVDHSTISPSATVVIAKQFKAKGVPFLDAPISGGDVGARNATLSIMVGGDQA